MYECCFCALGDIEYMRYRVNAIPLIYILISI